MKNLIKILALMFSFNLQCSEWFSHSWLSVYDSKIVQNTLDKIKETIKSNEMKEVYEKLDNFSDQYDQKNYEMQLFALLELFDDLAKLKCLEFVIPARGIIEKVLSSDYQEPEARVIFHDDKNEYGYDFIDFLKNLKKKAQNKRNITLIDSIIFALETKQNISKKTCISILPEFKTDKGFSEYDIKSITETLQIINKLANEKALSKEQNAMVPVVSKPDNVVHELKRAHIAKAIDCLNTAKSNIDQEMSEIIDIIIVNLESFKLSQIEESLTLLEALKENDIIKDEINQTIKIVNNLIKTNDLITSFLG